MAERAGGESRTARRVTAVSLACLPGRRTLAQFVRYGVSGGAAIGTHLAVLAALVELADNPAILASAIGFACGTFVNYALQHRFVFARSSATACISPATAQ
jgi:putative flippase GtrA